MNTTFFRRTLAAFLVTLSAGSAIDAAEPMFVLESHRDAGAALAFAIESRPLCVRFAVVVTENTLEVGPTSGCPACRTKDLA